MSTPNWAVLTGDTALILVDNLEFIRLQPSSTLDVRGDTVLIIFPPINSINTLASKGDAVLISFPSITVCGSTVDVCGNGRHFGNLRLCSFMQLAQQK